MTYAKARERLFAELRGLGWKVAEKSTRAPWSPLKIPYADSPNGGTRFWFKPQGLWYSHGTDYSEARSTFYDIRVASVERLVSVFAAQGAHGK